jgi:carboxypeptidase T
MKMTLSLFTFLFSLTASLATFAAEPSVPAAFAPLAGRDYAGVVTYLTEIANKYGANAQLFTLGDSDSGQKIIGIALGHGAVRNLVVATHHGNEYGSTEVALRFAYTLALQPIPNQTVFVIPVLNISGYNQRQRNETSARRRASFDPNRNYPSPCGTEGPFTLKSTTALARFVAEQNIVASATLHTYSPAVTFPWGLSTKDLTTGYESIFKALGAAATQDSRYPYGNTSQLIYPANGTFEDYAFLQHGIWSLLFELGSTHNPNAAQVEQMIKVNVPGLRRMMENAPTERAAQHAFKGKCDKQLESFDRHDE